MRHRPGAARRAIGGVAALLLVLASCGRSEPDQAAAPPPADAAAPPADDAAPPADDAAPPEELEAPPQIADTSSSQRLTLHAAGTVDAAPLGYAEYLPPDHEAGGSPSPLLVFLHGSDESGPGTQASLDSLFVHGLPALIQDDRWPDDRPFIVLMPQYGTELARSCQLGDDIDAFLDFALDHYDVDEGRVYLTGVSCGASGAWGYLAEHGNEVVAAAVLIAGRAVGAYAEAGCELGRVPLWVFHGEDDDIVPAAAVTPALAQLDACTDPPPVDVRLTLYPGVDHESWDQTYDLSAGHDVYGWLLGHDRA